MRKLLALALAAVVLPLLALVALVAAVTGIALNGAGAAGYDVGLTTCLSPPPSKPWSASQAQAAAVLVAVERKAAASPRAEQFAVAAGIWQSDLIDLTLTSTAATTSSLAGVFAEGASWGTLPQRQDTLSQAGIFATRLQGASWQSGGPWPVLRSVLGLPQPASTPLPPAPPTPPPPPPGNPTVQQLRAYETDLASYETALAKWTAKNAGALKAAKARQAREDQVWSEAGALVAATTAYWAKAGC